MLSEPHRNVIEIEAVSNSDRLAPAAHDIEPNSATQLVVRSCPVREQHIPLRGGLGSLMRTSAPLVAPGADFDEDGDSGDGPRKNALSHLSGMKQ